MHHDIFRVVPLPRVTCELRLLHIPLYEQLVYLTTFKIFPTVLLTDRKTKEFAFCSVVRFCCKQKRFFQHNFTSTDLSQNTTSGEWNDSWALWNYRCNAV